MCDVSRTALRGGKCKWVVVYITFNLLRCMSYHISSGSFGWLACRDNSVLIVKTHHRFLRGRHSDRVEELIGALVFVLMVALPPPFSCDYENNAVVLHAPLQREVRNKLLLPGLYLTTNYYW